MKAPGDLMLFHSQENMLAQQRSGTPVRANCLYWIVTAEKELAAFIASVEMLFGVVATGRAVQYWLEELENFRVPCTDIFPDWRQVTITAATHFAKDMQTHPILSNHKPQM